MIGAEDEIRILEEELAGNLSYVMQQKYAKERILYEHSQLAEEERLEPDTFYCERLFLETLRGPEFYKEIAIIAQDFLYYEITNSEQNYKFRHLKDVPWAGCPWLALIDFILNLMMGAVRNNSETAREQFCRIHKAFFKKEYNRMKRYRSMSKDDVLDIAKEDGGSREVNVYDIARILCMARMYGIELKSDCSLLYVYVTGFAKDREEECKEAEEKRNRQSELTKEQTDGAWAVILERFGTEGELYDLTYRTERFIGQVLQFLGYPEDYLDLLSRQEDDENSKYADYIRAVAIFRKCYPERMPEKEDVAVYTGIYRCLSALGRSVEETDKCVKLMFGTRLAGYLEKYHPRYKMLWLERKEAEERKQSERIEENRYTDSFQVDKSGDYVQQLRSELEQLRTRLHQAENENAWLWKELSDSKRQLTEQKVLDIRLAEERMELAALREHVYRMTDHEVKIQIDAPTLASMKQRIAKLDIVIIGGYDYWLKKLKQIFPKWTYISANVGSIADGEKIEHAKKVFFFTDAISHSLYYRYIHALRELKVPFGYLHSVNVENNIVQIYEETERQESP